MINTIEALVEQVGPATSRATVRTHTVFIDRPLDKGGDDRGPLGGELLLVSLGGCFMSHLLAAIRAREAPVSDARISVAGTLDDAPQRFTAITLSLAATCEDPELLKKLASIAERGCQVTNTLKQVVPISLVVEASGVGPAVRT